MYFGLQRLMDQAQLEVVKITFLEIQSIIHRQF